MRFVPRLQAKGLATRFFSEPLARGLHRLHVTPNGVTLAGLALSGAAGWLASDERLMAAGWVLLAGASLDMVDGALARLQGSASKQGAYLDSLADRLGEAALLVGLLAYYVRAGHTLGAYLAFGTVVLGGAVSYARARAEGLGIPGDVGVLGRPERIVVLVAGLVAGYPLHAMAVICVLAAFTVAQRTAHVWRHGRGA